MKLLNIEALQTISGGDTLTLSFNVPENLRQEAFFLLDSLSGTTSMSVNRFLKHFYMSMYVNELTLNTIKYVNNEFALTNTITFEFSSCMP